MNLFSILVEPEKAFREKIKESNLGKGILLYFLAAAVAGALFFIGIQIGEGTTATVLKAISPAWILLGYPIILLLGSLLLEGFTYATAKVLNGKGRFTDQYFLLALTSVAFIPITIVLSILSWIPLNEQSGYRLAALIITIFFMIYLFYINMIRISVVHQISYKRSLFAILIPAILLTIVFMTILVIAVLAVTVPGKIG